MLISNINAHILTHISQKLHMTKLTEIVEQHRMGGKFEEMQWRGIRLI
jgi:hypothetical protein